jgi:serpin B
MNTHDLRSSFGLLLLTSVAACLSAPSTRASEDVAAVSSRCTRDDRADLVAGNTAFALDLYRRLASAPGAAGTNLFFSPYSISLGLAMTYAGARGLTAGQIADTAHFTLSPDRFQAAFGALDRSLESGGGANDSFHLTVACSLWLQQSLTLESPFLATLGDDYAAWPQTADFAHAPDAARVAIDAWVSDRTEGAIPELFGPGSIGRDSSLVLADAIDFDAAWSTPFDPNQTATGPFYGADGNVENVLLMHTNLNLAYAQGDGWQAVAIPYAGAGVSMVVLLPADGTFDAFESGFDPGALASMTTFAWANVSLTLPRFSVHPGSTSLRAVLEALGATDAFDPTRADFSGMTTTEPLSLGDVVHQAIIDVDENGTHAAAATGVTIVGTAVPAVRAVVTVDRPFVYAIRDNASGSILFLGRVGSI